MQGPGNRLPADDATEWPAGRPLLNSNPEPVTSQVVRKEDQGEGARSCLLALTFASGPIGDW